ncbi:hypothetical protein [Streptomyces sudanensis]|uniref:hypothetical protein n=1 Tax=Streptomyces sudanensis TaxID=436397 RepID=UPI0020CC4062|nr:hypothetical protein [Streptomyces sudanensis]MCP9957971.1 hypothetical protein [Streptomyces sudanensis]MCP9987093.1 hypothetical protein [Streptomyces sudanensis]MCQ0001502.1 hypothetical protein [Streptomyces sudanensis]
MKPTKMAAVLVGSVLATGGAAPAFAADALAPAGLDGAVRTLGGQNLAEAVPTRDITDVAEVAEVADRKPVGEVAGTTTGAPAPRSAAPLLGGLPLGR